MDKDLPESLGLAKAEGALVVDVVSDSPAEAAGVEVGDVITRFDGEPVADPKSLTRLVSRAESGSVYRLMVVRNGDERQLQARIGAPQADAEVASAGVSQFKSELGLQLVPLGDRERHELGLDDSVQGVVVTNVERGSEAEAKGIRRGDVISRVYRQAVKDPKQFRDAIKAAKDADNDQVAVLVQSGEGRRFVSLGLA